MKDCTLFRSRKHGLIQKALLVALLVVAVMVVSASINWTYLKMKSGVGEEAAQVAVALQVIIVLILAATSLGFTYLMDWAIRRQRFIFRTPIKGGCVKAILRIWGYQIRCQEQPGIQTAAVLDLSTAPELMLDKPKRRGRKPTFPLDRWLPIAAKWENRDPIRDAFTLGELIAQHLGTNPDGTPIVSEQTYYTTWRSRAIKELQRRTAARQKAFGSKGQTDPPLHESKS